MESIEFDLVIVSHNCKFYLKRLLQSLGIMRPSKVVVVDNASTDGTKEYLQTQLKQMNLDIICNDENPGYGRALNEGIKLCKNEVVGLLNEDIEFIEDIDPMLKYFVENKDVAVIGPKQINDANKIVHGGFYSPSGDMNALQLKLRGWMQKDEGQYEVIEDVPTVSGSCYFVKRKQYQELGGFLEVPLYFEETFYAYLVRHKGFRVVYYGKTKVKHSWMRATEKMPEARQKWFRESQKVFLQRCKEEGIEIK